MEERFERNDLAAARVIADLEDSLARDGIVVVQRADQKAFETAHGALTNARSVSPPLSSRTVDIDHRDLFWIDARFEDGNRVAVQAMRREIISVPLSRHLDQQYRRLYSDPVGAYVEGHAPAADRITGTIAYHGDLFVAKTARDKGLASRLSNLAILIAHMRWDPDYIWGFISEEKVRKGYAQRIGYWNSEPSGTWYSKPPAGILETDFLVYIDRMQLNYRVELDRRRRERLGGST